MLRSTPQILGDSGVSGVRTEVLYGDPRRRTRKNLVRPEDATLEARPDEARVQTRWRIGAMAVDHVVHREALVDRCELQVDRASR